MLFTIRSSTEKGTLHSNRALTQEGLCCNSSQVPTAVLKRFQARCRRTCVKRAD